MVLISKIIQVLANNSLFGESHDNYLKEMNTFLELHRKSIDTLIKQLSTFENDPSDIEFEFSCKHPVSALVLYLQKHFIAIEDKLSSCNSNDQNLFEKLRNLLTKVDIFDENEYIDDHQVPEKSQTTTTTEQNSKSKHIKIRRVLSSTFLEGLNFSSNEEYKSRNLIKDDSFTKPKRSREEEVQVRLNPLFGKSFNLPSSNNTNSNVTQPSIVATGDSKVSNSSGKSFFRTISSEMKQLDQPSIRSKSKSPKRGDSASQPAIIDYSDCSKARSRSNSIFLRKIGRGKSKSKNNRHNSANNNNNNTNNTNTNNTTSATPASSSTTTSTTNNNNNIAALNIYKTLSSSASDIVIQPSLEEENIKLRNKVEALKLQVQMLGERNADLRQQCDILKTKNMTCTCGAKKLSRQSSSPDVV